LRTQAEAITAEVWPEPSSMIRLGFSLRTIE
jgi:hypothetical protein